MIIPVGMTPGGDMLPFWRRLDASHTGLIQVIHPAIGCLAGAIALSACLPSLAESGQNSTATAYLYWQEGTGAALSSQGTSSGTPQLLVTVKKLKNFRGADVQLLIQAQDYLLRDAWK